MGGEVEGVQKYWLELVNEVRATTPGLSHTMPPRRDFWGEPLRRQVPPAMEGKVVGPIFQSVSPAAYFDGNTTLPEERAILDNHVVVRWHGRRWKGIEMTTDEFDFYAQRAGKHVRREVRKVIATTAYARVPGGPEGGKAAFLRRAIRQGRAQAHQELLDRFPNVAQRIQREAQRRLNKREGLE